MRIQKTQKPNKNQACLELENNIDNLLRKIKRYEAILLAIKKFGLTAKNLEDLEDLSIKE